MGDLKYKRITNTLRLQSQKPNSLMNRTSKYFAQGLNYIFQTYRRFSTQPPPWHKNITPKQVYKQIMGQSIYWRNSKRKTAPCTLEEDEFNTQPNDLFVGWESPYKNTTVYLRVNNFPFNPLYSIIVDDDEICHFDLEGRDWTFQKDTEVKENSDKKR